MVIFTVDVKDETEKALAKIFLQQFAGAQKQVSQSPHCELRRASEPPKEIPDLVDGKSLGHLSFTFFPSHLKTSDRRMKAVELMVNFFPYLDKHVKSTKSYMHSRMRTKKDDLLRELKETSTRKEVGKMGTTGKARRGKVLAPRYP
jgi:actin related protein 2/3 complex subunit 2